jgi:hypothetical protein
MLISEKKEGINQVQIWDKLQMYINSVIKTFDSTKYHQYELCLNTTSKKHAFFMSSLLIRIVYDVSLICVLIHHAC